MDNKQQRYKYGRLFKHASLCREKARQLQPTLGESSHVDYGWYFWGYISLPHDEEPIVPVHTDVHAAVHQRKQEVSNIFYYSFKHLFYTN